MLKNLCIPNGRRVAALGLNFSALLAAGMLSGAVQAQTYRQEANQSLRAAQETLKNQDARQSTDTAAATPLRKELAGPMQAAQELIKAQQFNEALARIRETDAVPQKTTEELLVIARMRAVAAYGAGDIATATASWETVLASGQMNPADRLKVMQALYGMHFNARNYPLAIDWMNRFTKEGGVDPALRPLLIRSYYLNGDTARAATELQTDFNADAAAGRTPPEDNLKLMLLLAEKQTDKSVYTTALERLATYYPKKEYSASLLSRVLAKPGFSERLSLDVYRLRLASGPLKTAGDYIETAQLALQAGFPAEAKKVVELGYQAGLLGTGPDAAQHKKLADQAARGTAEDLKTMNQGEAAAAASRDGNGQASLGYAFATSGQADKGTAMMESGIAKGGLKRPDDVKLHLGIAYLAAGKKAEAIRTFKTVQGTDGTADLARLWIIQANQPAQ